LGRDKIKSTTSEEDEIEEQLSSDKLKADKSVADGELKMIKNVKFDEKVADEKSRRFVIF
jgi:hypothetical protein